MRYEYINFQLPPRIFNRDGKRGNEKKLQRKNVEFNEFED